jgi:hypothetical protein
VFKVVANLKWFTKHCETSTGRKREMKEKENGMVRGCKGKRRKRKKWRLGCE